MPDVDGGVEISMCLKTAHETAKRLLVGPVGAIWIMAHAALLLSGSGASRDGWSRIIINNEMRELLVADVEIHFQALTLSPADVLSHIGSPFAPDKAITLPQALAA